MNKIIEVLFCHLLGDYVLQIDYISKTKKDNFYNLIVHCILYCVPFYFLISKDLIINLFLCIFHIFIDKSKTLGFMSYAEDKFSHIVIIYICFVASIEGISIIGDILLWTFAFLMVLILIVFIFIKITSNTTLTKKCKECDCYKELCSKKDFQFSTNHNVCSNYAFIRRIVFFKNHLFKKKGEDNGK